jgi:hypothetical protein
MSRHLWVGVLAVLMGVSFVAGAADAGGRKNPGAPPLDGAVMAFKEQGVWYFPCVAPEFHWRIPPHYLTCAPPPPCWPAGPPRSGQSPTVPRPPR